MAGPNPPAPPLEAPSPAAAAAEGAPQHVTAAAGAMMAAATNEKGGMAAWERLLAGSGDDLLTCVFEFLQVSELATA